MDKDFTVVGARADDDTDVVFFGAAVELRTEDAVGFMSVELRVVVEAEELRIEDAVGFMSVEVRADVDVDTRGFVDAGAESCACVLAADDDVALVSDDMELLRVVVALDFGSSFPATGCVKDIFTVALTGFLVAVDDVVDGGVVLVDDCISFFLSSFKVLKKFSRKKKKRKPNQWKQSTR